MKNVCSMVLILLLFVTGCKNSDTVTFSKANIDNISGQVNDLGNGYYLFEQGNKDYYLLLNGVHVEEGAKAAPYFSDVTMDVEDNQLNIYFSEKYSKDYENKELDNQLVYKIYGENFKEEFDSINIYKNNEEISFTSVIAGNSN